MQTRRGINYPEVSTKLTWNIRHQHTFLIITSAWLKGNLPELRPTILCIDCAWIFSGLLQVSTVILFILSIVKVVYSAGWIGVSAIETPANIAQEFFARGLQKRVRQRDQ